MKYLLVLSLFLVGCGEAKTQCKIIYRHDNTICHYAPIMTCGVHLTHCENGLQYFCVQNVKEERL